MRRKGAEGCNQAFRLPGFKALHTMSRLLSAVDFRAVRAPSVSLRSTAPPKGEPLRGGGVRLVGACVPDGPCWTRSEAVGCGEAPSVSLRSTAPPKGEPFPLSGCIRLFGLPTSSGKCRPCGGSKRKPKKVNRLHMVAATRISMKKAPFRVLFSSILF